MMDAAKLTIYVALAAVLISLLKKYQSEYAIVGLAACSACLLFYILNLVNPVLEKVLQIGDLFSMPSSGCIFKAIGISLLVQTMQDICRDIGLQTLANKMELAGRCLILITMMPMLETVVRELIPFLQ